MAREVRARGSGPAEAANQGGLVPSIQSARQSKPSCVPDDSSEPVKRFPRCRREQGLWCGIRCRKNRRRPRSTVRFPIERDRRRHCQSECWGAEGLAVIRRCLRRAQIGGNVWLFIPIISRGYHAMKHGTRSAFGHHAPPFGVTTMTGADVR